MKHHSFLKYLSGKVLLHSIFWLGIFMFFTYFFEKNEGVLTGLNSFAAFLMPVTIGTTYVFNYFLIPKYLLSKKYLIFGLYSVATLILSAFAIIISIFYGLIYINALQYNQMVPLSKKLIFPMVAVYMVVFLVSAFQLLKYNYSFSAKNIELENKILSAQLKLKEQELQYLRMQIHPHFLFNTLNTIYGYALKKSKETPEMILKLSNLLDYLLYQVDKPIVSLAGELSHITDYIALEKMRFHDTLSVHVDFADIDPNINMPPMLLIPFVENCFKHGDRSGKKLNIYISLKTQSDKIYFNVKNSIKGEKIEIKKSGIGLANVKKRLNILYPDNYTLTIQRDSEYFEINLILNHLKLIIHG